MISGLMKIRFNSFLILLGAGMVLFLGGCVVKRTVTQDGSVVAEGYVFKGPFMKSSAGY